MDHGEPLELMRNYEKREWVVRHIPVRVKGRSPRPYRIPRLWISIMLGVCLYLAVHLNSSKSLQTKRVYLRRTERDLSGNMDYFIPQDFSQTYYRLPSYDVNGNSTFQVVNNGMRPRVITNVVEMDSPNVHPWTPWTPMNRLATDQLF